VAEFVNDPFTVASDTALASHTAFTTWTRNTGGGGGDGTTVDAASDTLINTVNNTVYWTASGSPAGTDYDVEDDCVVQSLDNFRQSSILGRSATTTLDFYQLELDPNDSIVYLRLYTGGTPTTLDSWAFTAAVQTYALKLVITDAEKAGYVDGTKRVTSSNNFIGGAGKSGLSIRNVTASAGPALDNFKATDAVAGGVAVPLLLRDMRGNLCTLNGGFVNG